MTSRTRRLCLVFCLTLAWLFGSFAAPSTFASTAQPAQGLQQAFSDVALFPDDLNLLGALRVVQGDEGLGGPVRPRDLVTRAEFITVVLRLGGLEEEAERRRQELPPFVDGETTPPWAWGYVNAARHLGFVTGYEDGSLRPRETVALAEALAMLSRLLGRDDEVREGLAWPESFLELGDRTGLSGLLSGYGHLELDRASVAHLAVNALRLELGHGGSGDTLLEARYGFLRGRLTDSVAGQAIVVGNETIPLADPFVWAGAPPDELVSSRTVAREVDVVRLPDGRAAFVGPSGSTSWSPESCLGCLSEEVSPWISTTGRWWAAYLAEETGRAAEFREPGPLTSAKVQLVLPRNREGQAWGFVRLKGFTTEGRLQALVEKGDDARWQELVLRDGSFDQRVWLTQGRGSYRVHLMTPVPDSPDHYYYDLNFTVGNQLALSVSTDGEFGLTWPRAKTLEARGFVDLVGFAAHDRVYVRLIREGECRQRWLPCKDGFFSHRLWLTRGPGPYTIRFGLPLPERGEAWFRWVGPEVTVLNLDPSFTEWLAPTEFILPGAPEVRELAWQVAGQEPDEYLKARALYRWITENIAYDYRRSLEQNRRRLTTPEILERRRGVCQEYADLFAALCRSLGIQARVVYGRAGDGGEGHAWNEFMHGGRWVAVEPTWGAGFLRQGVFHHRPTMEWFDRDLSQTHVREGIQRDWYPLAP